VDQSYLVHGEEDKGVSNSTPKKKGTFLCLMVKARTITRKKTKWTLKDKKGLVL